MLASITEIQFWRLDQSFVEVLVIRMHSEYHVARFKYGKPSLGSVGRNTCVGCQSTNIQDLSNTSGA